MPPADGRDHNIGHFNASGAQLVARTHRLIIEKLARDPVSAMRQSLKTKNKTIYINQLDNKKVLAPLLLSPVTDGCQRPRIASLP
jgi:hypothetical protein